MSCARPTEAPISEADTAGLPAAIAADLLEASMCCAFGAYRAAGLLSRRAVEQVAVLAGVPPGALTFQQKLAWLLQAGHLPRQAVPDVRAARALANAAAHGAEGVTRDEAWSGVSSALAVAVGVLVRD
jgi:hypothetical protein